MRWLRFSRQPSWFKYDEDMETSSVQPNLLAPLGDLWRKLKKEQANLSFPQSELEAVFKSLIDDTWKLTCSRDSGLEKNDGETCPLCLQAHTTGCVEENMSSMSPKIDRTRRGSRSWTCRRLCFSDDARHLQVGCRVEALLSVPARRVARFRNNLHERL